MEPPICFVKKTDGRGRASWERTPDSPFLKRQGGQLWLELPSDGVGGRAHVNGHRVAGSSQVVQPGDIVRIHAGGESVCLYVAETSAARTPGRGRICQFTGEPILDMAAECPCGALFSQAAAEKLEICPVCRASLRGECGPPPEELL